MGNDCCQQQKLNIHEINVSSNLTQQEFHLVDIPKDDPFLNQKILQYQQLNTPKVMKHLTIDKYYWGQWQEGAPKADGFLYVPEKYFYKGKFNLKPNHQGEIQFIKTGLKYKGQISEGKAEGTGILTHINNLVFYEGQWKDSQPLTGKLILRQNSETKNETIIQFNEFPAKDTKISYPDGREYVGTIHSKKFIPEGRGKVTYPGGQSYEGEWYEGQFHGQGLYTWNDGSSYEGSYQYGLKHGFGKYVYDSKKMYEGEWIKGIRHGRGCLFNQRGDLIKKGIWNQDKFLTSDQI